METKENLIQKTTKQRTRARDLLVLSFVLLFILVGCAGMSPTERHVATGAAIGAGTGAVVGEVAGGRPGTGAVIGGAAGALGGYLYDQSHRNDDYYHHGYRGGYRDYDDHYHNNYNGYQYPRGY